MGVVTRPGYNIQRLGYIKKNEYSMVRKRILCKKKIISAKNSYSI